MRTRRSDEIRAKLVMLRAIENMMKRFRTRRRSFSMRDCETESESKIVSRIPSAIPIGFSTRSSFPASVVPATVNDAVEGGGAGGVGGSHIAGITGGNIACTNDADAADVSVPVVAVVVGVVVACIGDDEFAWRLIAIDVMLVDDPPLTSLTGSDEATGDARFVRRRRTGGPLVAEAESDRGRRPRRAN